MTNYDSNYAIAQEISARIGNSPIPFDSVYSICLEIYNELGGEPAEFDSVYEILLGILPLVEGGGSKVIDDTSIRLDKTWSSSKISEELSNVQSNPIIDVSVLPDASENKDKLFRLDNGEKDVYAAKLLSSETTTTNRLPDAQQIDKAYLYDYGDICYYKGSYKIVLTDGELDGYGWYKYNEGIWYMYVTEDNAVNLNDDTITYITNNDEISEIEIDTVNKVITLSEYTVDDFKQSYGYAFNDLSITAIPATYNAPESAQIGNATIVDDYTSDTYYYNGTSVTLVDYDGTTIEGYEWRDETDGDLIVSTHKASEIFYYHDNDNVYLGDTIFYNLTSSAREEYWNYDASTNTYTNINDSLTLSYYNMNTGEGFNKIDALYIPQLNAPDSEQVDNAYIIDENDITLTYKGTQVTLTGSNGVFNGYLWENEDENVVMIINTNATNTFSNSINYSAENGDIVKIDDTHYEARTSELDVVQERYLNELIEYGYEIHTVKYKRTVVTEVWDWEPLTDNATNDDIDLMFDNEIKLIRYQDAEQQAEGFVDMWVNTSGETMEYDGNTYYKWVAWYNNPEADITEPIEHPYLVMLTNTLDITLPFNIDSPEYEYTITYYSEGDICIWSDAYFHGDYTQKTVQ